MFYKNVENLLGGCLTCEELSGILLGGVSDSEELVGGWLLTGDDGVGFLEIRLNLRRSFGGKNGCIYELLRAT